MSGKRRRTENGTENDKEAPQTWKCPVCESYFNSEASVLQHLRNKKDYEHEQHRLASFASEPSTVKKRGAASDSEAASLKHTTSGHAADGHEKGLLARATNYLFGVTEQSTLEDTSDPPLVHDGKFQRKKDGEARTHGVGQQSDSRTSENADLPSLLEQNRILTTESDEMQRKLDKAQKQLQKYAADAKTTSTNIKSLQEEKKKTSQQIKFLQEENTRLRADSNRLQDRLDAKLEQMERLQEENTRLHADSNELQDRLDAKLEQMERLKEGNKRLHADSLDARSREQDYKEKARSDYNKLKDRLDAKLEEVDRLQNENNKMRAACSETTAGNNDGNADFPFKKDIKTEYKKCINRLWAKILDDYAEEKGIDSACQVSKEIFAYCQNIVSHSIVAPQLHFKAAVKAEQGKGWEATRVLMTKLQRSTRSRVLSQVEDKIGDWAQEMEKKAGLTNVKLFEKGSLKTCATKLLRVI